MEWGGQYFQSAVDYFYTNLWIIQVFVVVLGTMVANFFVRRLLHKLEDKAQASNNLWDDTLIRSVKKPARLLVWIVGLFWAADVTRLESDAAIFEFVEPARSVAVIFLISWWLVRVTREAEELVRDPDKVRKPMDTTTALALGNLIRASIVITSVLVVLQTLGFSISGVLAFGGIGGIAVGFAAKDLLANFFGGLMIYLDRPFAVGDWVRSPDKDIEGTVEHIGWRLTMIRRFDKRPLYVPNATFTNIAVENPSRMTHRRIYETIGVRYDDAAVLSKIVADVKQMLIDHPDLDTNQTLIVNINEFAASSIDFFIYTFTKTVVWTEYHEVKQDVLMKVLNIIEGYGAEVAFPTQTVHLPDQMQSPETAGLA
jgi:MscS family membrane protein